MISQKAIASGKIGGGGIALFARWAEDFDCGYETSWWYVIKDEPFDISALKAKRRYEINKGKKNFDVKRINPKNYIEELIEVSIDAYSGWPEKYRPLIDKVKFREDAKKWTEAEIVIFAGFDRGTGEMVAWSYLTEYTQNVEFNILRAKPDAEKKGINAAMVAAIVETYNDRLKHNFYIDDGSRSVRHETAFQDYLEKYFGFRKAYCKLKINYRFPLNIVVKLIYPFRKCLNNDTKFVSLLSAIMKMETIRRSFEE